MGRHRRRTAQAQKAVNGLQRTMPGRNAFQRELGFAAGGVELSPPPAALGRTPGELPPTACRPDGASAASSTISAGSWLSSAAGSAALLDVLEHSGSTLSIGSTSTALAIAVHSSHNNETLSIVRIWDMTIPW